MGHQINAKLSHKNVTYVKIPRLGSEISFLPIEELSTGRNAQDWIPLNFYQLCAKEKK